MPSFPRTSITLALLAVASCSAPASGSPAPAETSPGTASVAPETVLTAPTESAPPADPPAISPGSAGVFADDPPWPDAGRRPKLLLTWAVYPAREGSEDGCVPRRRHVELVARIGAVARRVSLGDVRGAMFADQQHVCQKADPSARPERGLVARVEFQEGGWVGFNVTRAPADTMVVTSWYAVCGACDDGKGNAVGCPADPDVVEAVFHVPADARVEERIVEVEGPGKEQRFACGG